MVAAVAAAAAAAAAAATIINGSSYIEINGECSCARSHIRFCIHIRIDYSMLASHQDRQVVLVRGAASADKGGGEARDKRRRRDGESERDSCAQTPASQGTRRPVCYGPALVHQYTQQQQQQQQHSYSAFS